MSPPKKPHRNAEKVVKCPVEGCDAEKLSRGIYLHVLRSAGNGHGEQGEIPDDVDLHDLEEVGTREVEVNYPEERAVETVARLCPYCGDPFKGKNGVLIHLGKVVGRRNHPVNASEVHEPEDFPIVELDEKENIIGVVSSRAVPLGTRTGEELFDESEGYATFTKDQFDYISEVIHSETDDREAKLIVKKVFLDSVVWEDI